MKFTLQERDALHWKSLMEGVHQVVGDEVNIICKPDGLHICAMDPVKISLLKLFLQAENYFTTYVCHTTRTYGISIAHLTQLLKCLTVTDSLTVEEEGDTLRLTVVDSVRTQVFTLRLMDFPMEFMDLPGLTYSYEARFSEPVYSRIMRDLNVTQAPDVTISMMDRTVVMETREEPLYTSIEIKESTQKGAVSMGMVSTGTTAEGDGCTNSYAYRIVAQAGNMARLAGVPSLSLSMKTSLPLYVHIPLGDHSYAKMYIAPKISD